MYQRLAKLSKTHSFFLFGARGSGKSSLIQTLFSSNEETLFIDLLNPDLELLLRHSPSKLKAMIESASKKLKWVIIDEVQKVPELLDIVHQLIEEKKLKFILTGSSSRKLKRSGANFLAGRAHEFRLFPLTFVELEKDFELGHALNYGTLPVLFSDDYKDIDEKRRFLKSYVNVYLKEEIISEQIVRKVPPFQRFLEIAAAANGEIINFSAIARAAKTDAKAVERYYQILEDTLLGHFVYGYDRSIRKQIILSPRFYFFDLGVTRAIKGELSIEVLPQTYEFGKLFESYVITEIIRLNFYLEKDFKLHYIKTKEGKEIDLVITKPDKKQILIEIKSGSVESQEDLPWLHYFKDLPEFHRAEFVALCTNTTTLSFGSGVRAYPWQEGIKAIFCL